MYTPPAFRVDDRDWIHGFVEAHDFGMLLSSAPLQVSHLPFHLIRGEDGAPDRLLCHLARANPQWQAFAGEGAEFGEGGALPEGGRQGHGTAPDMGRHGGVHEGVDRRVAEEREHRGGVGGLFTGVASGKGVGGGEAVAERGHGERLQGRAAPGSRNRDLAERRQKRGCFASRSGSVCDA